MTAYLAGLAVLRTAEHPRAAEIDGIARLTLAAMASFVGTGEHHAERPTCTAARTSIAERAGVSVATVKRALRRLESLGIIERDGAKGTVRWHLTLLSGQRRDGSGTAGDGLGRAGTTSPLVGQSDPQGGTRGGVRVTHKEGVRETHKQRVTLTPNPSESSDLQGGKRGRSGSAVAAPSAGAPGSAAAPSTESGPQGGVHGEIAEALGCSPEQAAAWAARKLAGATGHVRNETGFLRTCVATELAQRAAPSAPRKATAAAPKGKTAREGRPPTPARPARAVTAPADRAAAARRVLSGSITVPLLAAELGRPTATVACWVSTAKRAAVTTSIEARYRQKAVAAEPPWPTDPAPPPQLARQGSVTGFPPQGKPQPWD